MSRQEVLAFFDRNAEFIQMLPESDQLIVESLKKMKQADIGKMYGMTQGAVSAKFRKIRRRFEFLETVKIFDITNFEEDLKIIDEHITPFEVELLRYFAKTTSQSATARILNGLFSLSGLDKMNQVKVRYRFLMILDRLKQKKEEPLARKYFDFFSFINANIYMMYDLKLPQFDRM